MNKKIKKYLDEIAKTEKKIADLQQYLRGLPARLPFRAKLKQAIPACPAVLFYPVTDLFCAIMHIFYIFFFLLSEY